MCGIIGMFCHEPVAYDLYDGLIHLQHRGQDAAGILTSDERFYLKQGLGLVRDVFKSTDLKYLRGNLGIAHTRYPTAGGYSEVDIQPLWVGSPRGVALAHNGNLVNYDELADLIRAEHRHLNTSLDSEVLLLMLADELAKGSYSERNEEAFFEALCQALIRVFNQVKGSYSVVSAIIGKGLIAFRDPHGIRPLVVGERQREDGRCDYLFASETSVFYGLGFEGKGDMHPGEVAFVSSQTGKLYRRVLSYQTFRPCVFEHVYFARPDSTLDGISVYRARLRMGQNLAEQWMQTYPDLQPDIVIPAPFTANTAALSFANKLGVRYSEGLYKNPFVGRTFIMSNQKKRTRSVRYKLTPQRTEIANKKVLIVDDSIVRGTTSREIVKMVKEVGAKEIYFASSCPPINYPCFYGIDIPSSRELIAAQFSLEEIKNYLGVDALLYQKQDDLVEAVLRRTDYSIQKPCMACMDGQYICGKFNADKLVLWQEQRERAKEDM